MPGTSRPPVGAGREPAAAAVAAWLGDVLRPRLCAITGAPAAGKSRLLASAVDADLETSRAATAVFSVRGMTLHSAAWALAEQLALPGAAPATVLAHLEADPRRTTLVVAELDESGARCDGAGAAGIVAGLLAPLLALPHVRLLVEGRPEAVALLTADGAPAEIIDLDVPEPTDRAAFGAWVAHLAAARGIGDPAVVAAADSLYPNAGLAELALTAPPPGADPDVPAHDAVGRWLRGAPPVARAALEALAAAYEPVSWNDWHAWTTALTGDVAHARASVEAALPLAVRVGDRFALGCRPLREAVLRGRTPQVAAQIDNAIGRSLYEALPKDAAGRPDWSRTDAARARAVLRHAAATGTAGRIVSDPGCLAHADPVAVTAAIDAVQADGPWPLRNAWRSAGPALVRMPGGAARASALRLAALRNGDRDLANAFAQHAAGAQWGPRWISARPADPSADHWSGPVEALARTAADHDGERGAPGAESERGGPGPELMAAGANGAFHAFDLESGRPAGRVPGETARIRDLVPFPDGAVLHLDDHGGLGVTRPSGARSRAEHLGGLLNAAPAGGGDLDAKAVLATLTSSGPAVPTALGADERVATVALGDRTGAVTAWTFDAPAGPPPSCDLHTGPVTAVACVSLPGGRLVVSGGSDGTVRLWIPGEPPMPEAAARRDCPVTAVAAAVVAGRPLVAAGWADGELHFWDLETGGDAALRPGGTVGALVLGPGPVLYVGGAEGLAALDLDLDRLLGAVPAAV
ncbi:MULTISPECIES: WD40 repeat domain-containing protein [Actinomadura]|uniref:WD40 repeat domain-containing protein n=1 Tax=Actinomadura yumaensis TaxID=111807 RepID=A0ABW2CFU3_9ACTN|nr:WD40 repeat domain-containing protein [Actinomadura sp. J1-007]MWK34510.1 hypothetical protein [Actinomadura sp. J1-007]